MCIPHFVLASFSMFYLSATATAEIYPLSLHDALPICPSRPPRQCDSWWRQLRPDTARPRIRSKLSPRSEEHTSELQSRQYLVCRLLLEKKNKKLIDAYGATTCAESPISY